MFAGGSSEHEPEWAAEVPALSQDVVLIEIKVSRQKDNGETYLLRLICTESETSSFLHSRDVRLVVHQCLALAFGCAHG